MPYLTDPGTDVYEGVGAVVFGGDYQGLAIARGLGRDGIPVLVIDDEPSIARFSRYTTRAIRVASMLDAGFAKEVLEIGRREGLHGWVLYPTRDEIVASFSLHKAALEEVFRVPTPGWETIKWAWDKRLTYQCAEVLGIPTPSTWYVESSTELEALDLPFPVILKPAIKEHFIYATKVKALQANTLAELIERFDAVKKIIPPEEIMIQELVPGGGESQFSYCSFFKEGMPRAKMVVRRARQWPPDFARSSTCVETIDMPLLEEPSERFLQWIGYYGLSEVEYKFDRRDGKHKLLDVNPRTWGSHAIGRAAGVNFALMLFRDQLGVEVPTIRARAGIRWVRMTTHVPASIIELARGRLGLRSFLRGFGRFQIEAVFERDDPVPSIAELTLLPHLIHTRGTLRKGGSRA